MYEMAAKQASERGADEFELRRQRDRAAVEELLIWYTMSVDLRDWALFRSCFGEQVAVNFDPPVADVPDGPMTPEEWAAFAGAHRNVPEATQHYYSISSVRLDGNDAEALMYYRASHGGSVDAPPFLNNTYSTFRCRRTSAGWKIVEISTHSLPLSIELGPESADTFAPPDVDDAEGSSSDDGHLYPRPGRGSKRHGPASKRQRSAAKRR